MSVPVESPALVNEVPATAPVARGRIQALDTTKGVLVVCMVVYHCFNYSKDYSLGFKLLPFLPPSFILITGFLLGMSYARQRKNRDLHSSVRAFLRGLRLFAIFTLLNVLAQLAGRHHVSAQPQGLGYFFEHWFEVYVTGEGRLAAFEVLLPISYLLLLAPLLLLLDRSSRYLLPALALGLIVFSTILERQGDLSANLYLLTAGMLGMVLGRVSLETLYLLARSWWLWIATYAGYLVVAHFIGQVALMQLIGACLALTLSFSLCVTLGRDGFLQGLLVTLGRYSLVAYILQIGILQLLVRALGRLTQYSPLFFAQMLGVFLLMVLIVEVLDWSRRQFRPIDTVYKAAFA